MNDLNQVLLEGRLVRDPNGRRLESGTEVCTFSIASNAYYYDKEKGTRTERVTYMPVETWGNAARYCMDFLAKGDGVRVLGRLKQSRWKGEHKMQMERTFVLADHVEAKPKKTQQIPEPVKAVDEEPSEQDQEELSKAIVEEEPDVTPEVFEENEKDE